MQQKRRTIIAKEEEPINEENAVITDKRGREMKKKLDLTVGINQ